MGELHCMVRLTLPALKLAHAPLAIQVINSQRWGERAKNILLSWFNDLAGVNQSWKGDPNFYLDYNPEPRIANANTIVVKSYAQLTYQGFYDRDEIILDQL